MIVTRALGDKTWTDMHSPSKEEIDSVVLSKNIDPLIAKDLLTPTPRQQIREFDRGIYAVMHLPFFEKSHTISSEQEVDFVITPDELVTTRYDSIDALHHFAKQVEADEILNRENRSHLFFGLMKEIYRFLFDEAEYMRDWMKEVEKNIFDGKEKEMVFIISIAGRNLLNFKRTVDPHREVFEKLMNLGQKREEFGKHFEKEAESLYEDWRRLTGLIKNISDIFDELRETNNSILTTKQNEIMKIFTIMAFVTFPLSLVASIFGMNTDYIPIAGMPYDFFVVIGIMLLMSLAMFAYFRYKRWI